MNGLNRWALVPGGFRKHQDRAHRAAPTQKVGGKNNWFPETGFVLLALQSGIQD